MYVRRAWVRVDRIFVGNAGEARAKSDETLPAYCEVVSLQSTWVLSM